MTVIHGIEIDNIEYKANDIKRALRTRKPIEDKLHVIVVISNPCLFARRYILFREFIQRMAQDEPDVIVYVVEMAYGNQKFLMSEAKNPRHLQLRTETPIWHKENMINLGVNKLLPHDWKAFAWIDSDVEFDSPTWALDTLRILNGECDIVQVFSHCIDMDPKEQTLSVFHSAGFQYSKQVPFGTGKNLWHPGYGWACTREAYQIMGGLYDQAILGSGDNIMMMSLIGHGDIAINPESTDGYKASVREFQGWVKDLRFGYVPGLIRHFFHGHKQNRKYTDRWKILVDHKYDPLRFVHYRDDGVLVPIERAFPEMTFPKGLKDEIMKYFEERNEDEGVNADGKYEDLTMKKTLSGNFTNNSLIYFLDEFTKTKSVSLRDTSYFVPSLVNWLGPTLHSGSFLERDNSTKDNRIRKEEVAVVKNDVVIQERSGRTLFGRISKEVMIRSDGDPFTMAKIEETLVINNKSSKSLLNTMYRKLFRK